MENESKKKITVGRLGVVFAICMAMVMTSAVTSVGASLKLDSQTILIPDQMSYSFEFKEPSMKSINVDSSDYTTIIMPGCLVIGKQAGDPAMPVKVIQMLLPPKKTVSHISVIGTPVTVKLGNIDLREKPVLPQQQSVPIGSDQLPEFMINSNIYSTDATFPAARYSDYQVGYSHGYAILSLSLNPVQYNPMQGTLVYYPKMTVTITLKPDGTANQFFSNNPADEAYVETLVSNPDIVNSYENAGLPTFEYPGGLCDPGQNYDYVIITTTQNGLDDWDTSGSTPYNWESLMARHTGDGLSSTVVTVQAINGCSDYYNSTPLFNDSKAHIREFCRDAYEDWGTRYVLIAGDADTIPARQFYYSTEGNFDSDLYWSNLDNDFNSDHDSQWGESGDSGYDLYSEIYIGRITCDVPQDVSNWLTKCFYYADSAEWEYLDNAGFYGGALYFPGIEGDDFIDYSAIKGTDSFFGTDPDYAGPYPTWLGFQFGFETWNEVNPGNQFNLSKKITDEVPNPGWIGGGPSVLKTAINNDQITLLSAVAHADEHMSMDVYDTEWESQYHNTQPFFLTDYGCHCGDFDAADDGVIESMLFHSDTELAFGCVYNTAYGWGQWYCTNSSSAVQQKSFWDYFFDMENNSGDYDNWQLGKGHAWSKDMMAPTINWDSSDQTWRGTIGCCTLFADPAQTLKSPSPIDSSSIHVEKQIYTPVSGYPAEWTLTLEDSYGDGWNGGYLDVYVNGIPLYMGLTVATTGPESYPITVNSGDVIFIDYTYGSWAGENIWYLVDHLGAELFYQVGGSSDTSYDHTVTAPSGLVVDADTPGAAVAFEIGTTVQFIITVKNNGDAPITNICVQDVMDDSMEYVTADPLPDDFIGGVYYWESGMSIPPELLPDESFVITVWALVVGPHGSIDENYVYADADSDLEPFWVFDENSAFIYCLDPFHVNAEKYVRTKSEPAEFTLTLEDSYGDGWNGCYIDVYVNGNLILAGCTVPNGYGPVSYPIAVNDLDVIFIDFTYMSYPTECSWYLVDNLGNQLFYQVGGYDNNLYDHTVTAETGEWVDATDLAQGDSAMFLIAIKNEGIQPLTDIWVYDTMSDSLAFVNADPYPMYQSGGYMDWNFPGPLAHGETINIIVWATVVGEVGETDENYVEVMANGAFDSDSAFVTIADLNPPVTTHVFSGTMGGNDWYVSNVTITLTAIDGYSGVAYTMYSLDGASFTPYTGAIIVIADGTHSISYYSADTYGNVEATQGPFAFKIDQTKPVTTHAFSGTMGTNSWYVSDVTITLTATDATSGVDYTSYKIDSGAWTIYAGAVVISTDGQHNLYYNSTDNAGNTEATNGPFAFKMDKTKPEWINYSFTALNLLKTKWLCAANVEDDTSGIVLVEFFVDGALVGNATATPYEFTFNGSPTNNSQAVAYDAAGNSASSPIVNDYEYVVVQQQSQQQSTQNMQTMQTLKMKNF